MSKITAMIYLNTSIRSLQSLKEFPTMLLHLSLFFLRSLLFPSRGGRTWILYCECKVGQTDLGDSMSFLLFNLFEEFNSNPEALSANLESLSSAWNS